MTALSLTSLFVRSQQIEVSGDWYDWTKTLKPERPWIHDYSQTVVMKMFLCSRNAAGKVGTVYMTFDSALGMIKRVDRLTLGMPKIVYLVGWQFNGHDSGYPSWSEVNPALKRKQDATALQSLRWLIREARRYHTVVSLHINMLDAYKDSPLWDEYDRDNIILKDKAGNPIPGEVMDTVQSYQISYAREWKLGLAQKRIRGLLKMIPELKEGGTIHIDAFHSIQPVRKNDTLSSPFLGLTIEEEIAAQRKIFRYWRDLGIDATSEGAMYWLRKDPFIGLQPMAWHFDINDFRNAYWIGKPADFHNLPPSLYCGTPMAVEDIAKTDPRRLGALVKQFCTVAVPWYYANNPSPKRDLSVWSMDGDVFLPALWRPWTIVAYSEKGYTARRWVLPQDWGKVSSVTVTELSTEGPGTQETLPVTGGAITLSLRAGEGVGILNHHLR